MVFSSSRGGSPEIYMSVEELEEELVYKHALLASLDDNVEDREELETSIKAEIRQLKRSLRAQTEGTPQNHRSSQVGSSATMQFDNSYTSTSFGAPIIPANMLLSPTLPTRKRPMEDSPNHKPENKSRRTSPSRCAAGRSDSASDSGDEGISSHAMSRYREAEATAQRRARERIEQEESDGLLAASLQGEQVDSVAPQTHRNVQQPSQNHPNAYDRMFVGHAPPNQAGFSQYATSSNGFPNLSQDREHPRSVFGPNPGHVSHMPGHVQRQASDPMRLSMPGSFPQDSQDPLDPFYRFEMIPEHPGIAPTESGNGAIRAQRLQNPSPWNSSRQSDTGQPAVDSHPNIINHGAPTMMNSYGEAGRQLSRQPGVGDASHGYSQPVMQGPNRSGIQYSNGNGRPLHIKDETERSRVKEEMSTFRGLQPGLPTNSLLPNFMALSSGGPQPFSQGRPTAMDGLGALIDLTSNINWTPDLFASREHDYAAESRDHNRDEAKEINDLLDNFHSDEEIPKENRVGTPEGLKYALYEHQKVALTWLKSMEEGTNKGGILADDMGLGKTISALALMLSRPSTDRRRKTTLIITPVALIRQWEREIQTKLNSSHKMSTFVYHSTRKGSWDVLRNFDVVITSYGTIAAENKRLEAFEEKFKKNPRLDKAAHDKKCPLLGDSSKWYRIILDEAQCIKNKSTGASKGCCRLKSMTRFCLSGTPMMNGVHELYSLLKFLRIRPYNDSTKFNQDFGPLISQSTGNRYRQAERREIAMKKLRAVIKACLLRRTKTSKIDGKPIIQLPPKQEEVVHAIFDEAQQDFYTALEQKTRTKFNKYVEAGTLGNNYSNILVLLLRLRQAACHPMMIEDFVDAPPETSMEHMLILAKSLAPNVVSRIASAPIPFECPICLDPITNPRIIIPCGHDTCAECLVKLADTAAADNVAQGIEGRNNGARCPECRGSVDLLRIIDYNTFKQVHMKSAEPKTTADDDTESEDGDDEISLDSDSDSESDSESDSDVEDSDGSIRNFVVPDYYESEGETTESEAEVENDKEIGAGSGAERRARSSRSASHVKVEVKDEDSNDDDFVDEEVKDEAKDNVKYEVKDESSEDDEFLDIKDIKDIKPSGKTKFSRAIKSAKKQVKTPSKSKGTKAKKKKSRKGKGKKKEKDPEMEIGKKTLSMLKREASKNATGRKRYIKFLKKKWVDSAKTEKCVEILKQTEKGTKTIIFSQFTTLLDILEVPLLDDGVKFNRYDGTMTADARHTAVVAFTDDPRIEVMLVSLKAGNAGLNLTAASQVIILDPFWNPFVEMQAVDRAHRIGQQKPVLVHRILVKGTVEDRILDVQKRKREVIEAALDEKARAGLSRLTRQELTYIFNGGAERQTFHRPPRGASASPAPSL